MIFSLNKDAIINYFNEKSVSWDNDNIVNNDLLNLIFKNGTLVDRKSILDIGCGTGILFDYYLTHNAASITGLDISENMIKKASEKFNNIELICADACNVSLSKQFDLIVIYNTLPHIYDFASLFINCKKHLKKDGILLIAFGQSLEKTNSIHNNLKDIISNPLMPIADLSIILGEYFDVLDCISNNERYEIICVNRE